MSIESKIAHLSFIQSIISRMGNNSFLVKGWSITLVAATFALSAKDSNPKLIIMTYFPVIIFWFLDGFFLHQEKLFRKLYEKVASNSIPSSLFTLDTKTVSRDVACQIRVLFSGTLLAFHGVIISLVTLAIFILMK